MRMLFSVLVTSLFAALTSSGCSNPAGDPCDVSGDPAVLSTSGETSVPEVISDPCGLCRNHMRLIATMEAMFYAAFNRYGSIEALVEEGFGARLVCPGCRLDYDLELGFETYTLTCPMPQFPCHGSVVDGIYSWQ